MYNGFGALRDRLGIVYICALRTVKTIQKQPPSNFKVWLFYLSKASSWEIAWTAASQNVFFWPNLQKMFRLTSARAMASSSSRRVLRANWKQNTKFLLLDVYWQGWKGFAFYVLLNLNSRKFPLRDFFIDSNFQTKLKRFCLLYFA